MQEIMNFSKNIFHKYLGQLTNILKNKKLLSDQRKLWESIKTNCLVLNEGIDKGYNRFLTVEFVEFLGEYRNLHSILREKGKIKELTNRISEASNILLLDLYFYSHLSPRIRTYLLLNRIRDHYIMIQPDTLESEIINEAVSTFIDRSTNFTDWSDLLYFEHYSLNEIPDSFLRILLTINMGLSIKGNRKKVEPHKKYLEIPRRVRELFPEYLENDSKIQNLEKIKSDIVELTKIMLTESGVFWRPENLKNKNIRFLEDLEGIDVDDLMSEYSYGILYNVKKDVWNQLNSANKILLRLYIHQVSKNLIQEKYDEQLMLIAKKRYMKKYKMNQDNLFTKDRLDVFGSGFYMEVIVNNIIRKMSKYHFFGIQSRQVLSVDDYFGKVDVTVEYKNEVIDMQLTVAPEKRVQDKKARALKKVNLTKPLRLLYIPLSQERLIKSYNQWLDLDKYFGTPEQFLTREEHLYIALTTLKTIGISANELWER